MLRTGKCWELLWFLHCYVDDIGEVGLAGATVLKQSGEKTQTGWVSLKIIEQLFPPDYVKVRRVHPVAHDVTGGPDRRRARVGDGIDVGAVPQQNLPK